MNRFHPIVFLFAFVLQPLFSFGANRSFTAATAPSGTTSYCLGTTLTNTYTTVLNQCSNGTGIPINYQWNLNGSPVSGATGTFTPPTGSGDYSATLSALNISALAVGTYTITATFSISGGGCGSGTFTSGRKVINITAGITATVNATPSALCAGSTLSLSATPSGGSGYTYAWTGPNSFTSTTQNPTISGATTSATGVYSLTVTDSRGCVARPVTPAVTINAMPTVSAGSGRTVCTGSSVSLTASGATTYSWSPATGLSATTGSSVTSSPTSAITYTITGTNGGTCSNTSTVTVSVNPLPAISGGSNITSCAGSSNTLSATGGSTYTWAPGTSLSATTGTSVTASPASTIIYTVTGTNGAGCRNTATVTVSVNPLPTISGGSNTAICAGSSTPLSATGGSTYTWAPGTSLSATTGTSVTASPASTIIYTVTGTNGAGCRNTATVTVSVNPLPTISGGSNTAICAGSSTSLSATGGSTYTWAPGTSLSATTGTTVTASPASTVIYTVTGTNSAGCRNIASVIVTVNALPVVSAGSGTAICSGSSATLTASGAATYTWSPGGSLSATTGAGVTASPASTITYTVTGTTGSCSAFASVTVTVNTTTAVSAGSNVTVCSGSTASLTASGGITYTWSPGTGLSATTGASVSANPSSTTIYTVTGTNGGCIGTSSVTVSVNPAPTVYTVTGGGSYCAGGPGSLIGLSGSDSGYSYQLYKGVGSLTVSGSPVTGTGGAVSFGYRNISGTYTVVAANPSNSCTAAMTGSTVVSIVNAPAIVSVTGGGSYCSGSSGVNVGLSGSAMGVNYQLYNGASPVGSPVAGIGGSFNFGLQTAGTYSVVATSTSNGCTSSMSGTASVTTSAAPVAYTVTGGGAFCSGGSGVSVGLSNSQTGVNYQLYKSSGFVGSPVAGTGSAISFGTVTTADTFFVRAVNATTGCLTYMTGSAIVTIIASPTLYSVTGGGSYCPGGTGVSIGLSGSDIGSTYQLYNGTTSVGSAISGTGSSISFGLQTASGSYTVVANTGTSCPLAMYGGASVALYTAVTGYSVTGGGAYCSGGSGVAAGLSGSDIGTNYQMYIGATPAGSMKPGTGTALTFGTLTTAGTYTVVATSAANGCTAAMTGSASVTVNSLPAIYSVTGGGAYCTGGSGVAIGLSGSATGINYQLYNSSSVAVGSAVAGTGSAISFGSFTTAGAYSVTAVNSITGCSGTMTASAVVSVNAVPAVASLTGGGAYCSGASGVGISLSGSVVGVHYQLYNGTTPAGSSLAGVGGALSFGNQTAAGTYNAVATNDITGCSSSMSGNPVVSVNPLPAAYTVTGGGSFCSTGSGVAVGLSGSQSGVNYQLFSLTSVVGSPVGGSGSAVSFGPMTTSSIYNVTATNTSTGCTASMTGTVNVNAVSPASAGTISGPGSVYDGATIALTNSVGGGCWVASNSYVTVGSSSGIVTGVAAGYTNVSYSVSNICGTAITVKTIHDLGPEPLPFTGYLYGNTTVCAGSATQLSCTESGGTWSSSNNEIASVDPVTGLVYCITPGIVAVYYRFVRDFDTTILHLPVVVSATPDKLNITVSGTATIQKGEELTLHAIVNNDAAVTDYQWYLNNNIIPGATSAYYISNSFVNNDLVSCVVTGVCGNTVTSSNQLVTVNDPASEQTVTAVITELAVYPNPNTGVFRLKGNAGNAGDQIHIVVTDLAGRTSYEKYLTVINGAIDEQLSMPEDLAPGGYMLNIASGNTKKSVLLIIER